MPAKISFAQRLATLRLARHMSQWGLAKRAGLSVQAIRFLESGKRLPAWPTLQKLAVALECSIGCLAQDDTP